MNAQVNWRHSQSFSYTSHLNKVYSKIWSFLGNQFFGNPPSWESSPRVQGVKKHMPLSQDTAPQWLYTWLTYACLTFRHTHSRSSDVTPVNPTWSQCKKAATKVLGL